MTLHYGVPEAYARSGAGFMPPFHVSPVRAFSQPQTHQGTENCIP